MLDVVLIWHRWMQVCVYVYVCVCMSTTNTTTSSTTANNTTTTTYSTTTTPQATGSEAGQQYHCFAYCDLCLFLFIVTNIWSSFGSFPEPDNRRLAHLGPCGLDRQSKLLADPKDGACLLGTGS